MNLVGLAHWDQNPRRVCRNSPERLRGKQRTLFQWRLSMVPMPLKKASTEYKCQWAGFDGEDKSLLLSSVPIPLGPRKFPWAFQRGEREWLWVPAAVLCYVIGVGLRHWEPTAKAVGRPQPGFYVGVAESQEENSTRKKVKVISQQRKTSRSWLCWDQGHFSSRCGEGRDCAQQPGRVRQLREGRESQKTADEPAAASPPRPGCWIVHSPLCYPDATWEQRRTRKTETLQERWANLVLTS